MAAKQMNQLSTVSTAADSDLLLVYDIDEGGSEKTKTITYAEFETQISGAVGGGDSGPYNSLVDGGETGVLYTNGGAAELNYAGTKALATISNGAVIYNPTNNSYYLHVKLDSNVNLINDVQGGNFILEGELTGGGNAWVFRGDPDGAAELYYAGEEQLETTISGINVINGQIKFPAIQNPSSDVNTLDDYEEGTWTPVISDASTGGNTATAVVSAGNYTKIGRQVTLQCTFEQIDTSGMTGGNNLYIQGLPFSTASTFSVTGPVMLHNVTFSGNYVNISLAPSTDYFVLRQATSGSGWNILTVASLSSGNSYIHFTVTYFV